jgi:hypothetical protein
VCAIADGKGSRASKYVVGRVNPNTLGLAKGLTEDPVVVQARADAAQRGQSTLMAGSIGLPVSLIS